MRTRWALNDARLARRFQELQLSGGRKNTALQAMAQALLGRVQLTFRLGQSPYGAPWRPLNPAFRSGQPLRNSGRLQRSFTARVEGNQAVVGTNLIQARVHQFGAVIRPRTARALAIPLAGGGVALAQSVRIPARPFLPIIGNAVSLPDGWRRSAFNALRRAMNL